MATPFETWTLSQLSRLLPLDEESLKQIILYNSSLSKPAAAENLKDILGDSAQALEFITSFNSRRTAPDIESEVPNTPRKARTKKPPLHKLPLGRRANEGTSFGDVSGGYVKKDEGDYIERNARARKEPLLANSLALSEHPDAQQLPIPTSSNPSHNASPKPPPSAAGSLISDTKSSRSSSPAGKTKINLSGGTSMHGQSSTINDLDSAIRALEIQTNPSLSSDTAKRRCNCSATRHPLLAAAPNCLNCGKVICVKEGLGPCTFCGKPLLSADEIQSMVRSLREERGREKMEVNNSSQKRPEVSKAPRAFASASSLQPVSSAPSSDSESEKLTAAKQHRDKLLNYQSQNARRTHIIDEAADFETPTSGQSMWASPQERALQLKKQQKILREQEWNAKPEYEKRRVVVSVDLVGGKVVRRMGNVDRPEEPEVDEEVEEVLQEQSSDGGGGAFSRNPLLGGLIRPVYKAEDGKGKGNATDDGGENIDPNIRRRNTWRRVQDDNDDNEDVILDGGIYGGRTDNRRLGDEEHAQG
ncbi:MAG: hypothetical protein M1827_001137 [Pycnora praestabilis]|nr:MAG: hypothetical protein M1827_001137 [Pycnora praestabilis]